MTGEIPLELGDLSELTSPDLSDNQLTGEIPLELGELKNLNSVDLGGNGFAGCVPKSLIDAPFSDADRLELPTCN